LGDGHASRVGDTPSSGAPVHRTKRNKTIAAAVPLHGRPVTSVDQYGNAHTIHLHHTPPARTERYTMASSSDEDDSHSGVSESPAGRRIGYDQASASLVNPMGYEVIDESKPLPAVDPLTGYNISDHPQPLPAEAPMTYSQASAAFVNTMGYDEVEPIETTRSQVRSIFSGGSNHSGRSRFSDKGQKPFIESTPSVGALPPRKGRTSTTTRVSVGALPPRQHRFPEAGALPPRRESTSA
jgi:hypothetical protein